MEKNTGIGPNTGKTSKMMLHGIRKLEFGQGRRRVFLADLPEGKDASDHRQEYPPDERTKM